MDTRTSLRIAGLVLFLALIAPTAFSSRELPEPSLPEGCPEPALWQEATPSTRFRNGIVRTVFTNTPKRTITLEWGLCDPSWPNGARRTQSELFATSYWPTHAVVLDEHHFCVAGKAPNGDVVIERWTFGTTTTQGDPAPEATPYFAAGSTTRQFVWSLPPRVEVSEVLRAPATVTGLARALFRDPGSAQHVYVWYDRSRSVCRIDLSTGKSALSAAITPHPGAVTAPALCGAFDTFTCGDYEGKGYCLFFGQRSLSADGTASESLALIDSNRDGTLDAARILTSAAWSAEGWGSAKVHGSY